jgi:hypothetical protein
MSCSNMDVLADIPFHRAVSAFVEAELVRKKSAHKMVLQKKSLVSKQFCTEAGATVKILQN